MDDKRDAMLTYAGGMTMILGIWLAVSSLLFGLSPAAFTSQILVAMILILAGAAEMYSRSTWLSWLSAAAGLWLVISPIFISVSDAGFWNQMVVGLIAIGLGVWDRNVITSGLRTHAKQ